MRWRLILLVVVAEALLVLGVHLLWTHDTDEMLAARSRQKSSAYDAITQTYQRVSDLMHDTLFSRPGVLELFAAGVNAEGMEQNILRGRLLRTLWPDYQHMKRYSLVQLHFHTADGRSYLRFHKPEISGDDLLGERPSVRKTLETGLPIHGFENGKLFHGYRFVFPVSHNGTLIGSVETSINFEAIQSGLREVMPGHEFSFWLSRNNLAGRLKQDAEQTMYPVELNPDYAIEDLQARLEKQTQEQRSAYQHQLEERARPQWADIRQRMSASETFAVPIRLQGLAFAAMYFLPIHDVSGKQAGYLVGYGALPELESAARNYLLMGTIAAILLAALIFIAEGLRRGRQALQEERNTLRAITDNMLEGLFVQNPAGQLTYWNPALEKLLGFAPQQLAGSIAHTLIHAHAAGEGQVPIELCPIRRTTLRGETYYSDNEGFRTASGDVLPVEVTCAPVWRMGKLVGSVTVFRDITQRISLQQAQDEARRSAEHNAEMKAAFLANMSHEIRTPLNGVMGMLDLALDTTMTPEQHEYLGIARQSGEMLLALLNDILDVSKVDAGQLSLECVAFDLWGTVEHTGKLMAARAHQKDLELVVQIEPDVPRHVMGDPLRLRQVLLNLMGNAIKFTEQGEVVLAVSIADGRVVFEVRDTGIGISAEAQGRIFEAFVQADTSTTRKYGGTGLGLSLSRRLVELMGSRLQLSSALGEGSRFWFALVLPAIEHTDTDGLPDLTRLAGTSVLIVDDVLTNRLIIERHVLSWGMLPHGFCSAQDALAWMTSSAAASQPVGLAILDRMMPEVDGLELARRLRAQQPRIGIVLLSSITDQLEADALQNGLIDVAIAKPAGQEALAHSVLRALAHPAQPAPPTATTPATPRTETPTVLAGIEVLVVEDNAVNRMLAQRLLEREGAHILEAEDGACALQMLIGGLKPDIILMDCQMPVMDGQTAARLIRDELHSDVPILALTAHAGLQQVNACLDAGMDAVLSKPYEREQLLEAMLQLLDRVAPAQQTAPTTAVPANPSPEPPTLPLLDDNMLSGLESALGDEIAAIAGFFCENLNAQLNALVDAIERGDTASVKAQAHALKGSSGNLGAVALAMHLREIEQLAMQNALPSPEQTATLQTLVADTRRALQERY